MIRGLIYKLLLLHVFHCCSGIEAGSVCPQNSIKEKICSACFRFPFLASFPVQECCFRPVSLMLCEKCLSNPHLCKAKLLDHAEDNGDDVENSDNDSRVLQKRYGRVFTGNGLRPNGGTKKFRRLLIQKQPGSKAYEMIFPTDVRYYRPLQKRFWRLFTTRDDDAGKERDEFDDDRLDKRFGRLFTGGRKLGKRR